MAEGPTSPGWARLDARNYYLKVYLPRGDEDAYLVQRLKPLTDEFANEGIFDYFHFVRYHDRGGRHLRIRFFESPPRLSEARRNQAKKVIGDRLYTPGARLVEGRYLPELERYGGKVGARIAERLSGVSARSILQFLGAKAKGAKFSSTEFGILTGELLLVAAGIDSRGRNGFYLESAGPEKEVNDTALLPVVKAVSQFVDRIEGDPLAFSARLEPVIARIVGGFYEDLGRLFETSAEEFARLEPPLNGLLSSYVHMHYNRLGVPHPNEIIVRHVLRARAAGRDTA